MLYQNGHNLLTSVKSFISQSKGLTIFCPYIKLNKLKEILADTKECKIIVVRWELGDLVQQSSDLEVFDFCKKNEISLFRNPRLHQKVYLDKIQNECLITTANISERALSNNSSMGYNYEVGAVVKNLSLENHLYFQKIIAESTLIDKNIVDILQKKIIALPKPPKLPIKDIYQTELLNEKDFLISSLPMSFDVKTLFEIYQTNHYENNTDYECAIHDLALYHIPLGLSEIEFYEYLKTNFFRHPFIKAFLREIEKQGGEVYFGFVRKWLTQNCANTPTPRTWEITENVQILYRWIVALGEGKYIVDIPKSHSERLRIV